MFKDVGGYDEEMVRNQDDELNYRLRESGGKIVLSEKTRSTYFCRSSLTKLLKQYSQYGYWKVRVLQKHPRMMQPRQFVPPVPVLLLIVLGALSSVWRTAAIVLGVLLVLYAVLSISFSMKIAISRGWKFLPILPIIFSTLHFSYGVGFVCGLVRFATRWQREY